MQIRICLPIIFALALSAPSRGLSQFNGGTISIDGTVDAAYVTSGDWSMAWDDTYLYIVKTGNNNTNEPTLVYLDVDPLTVVSGGTNSDGSLTGQSNWQITPTLPFRSDVMIYWEPSYAEYRTRNGSGGWSGNTAIPAASGSATGRGNSGENRELRFRWDEMPGLSGRPSSFNWVGYNNPRSDNSSIYDQIPSLNPATDDPVITYYYTVSSTANDAGITSPFSQTSLSLHANASITSTTSLYDFTINGGTTTLSSSFSVNNRLLVNNGDLRSSGARTLTLSGTNGSITINNTSGGSITGTDAGSGNDLSLVISGTMITFSGNATTNSDHEKKFFNVTVNSGGALALSRGILCRYGTFTVNGTLRIDANGYVQTAVGSSKEPGYHTSTGTLVYNNGGAYTSAGEWPASSSPPNVTIQNSSSVSLSGGRTLNGTLTLTSGKLTLGTNKLTLGSSGTISGASSSNYVVTDNTGTIEKPIATSGSFMFPVGPSSSAYNPITVALDGSGGATFNVRVQGSVNPAAPDNNLTVQRTWNVDKGAGSVAATLTFQWLAADHGSSFSALNGQGVFRHNGSVYEQATTIGSLAGAGTSGSPYTASTVGTISTFSPFIIGQAGGLPVQLAAFTGAYINATSVRLNWRTVSELNNYGFYIERRRANQTEWAEVPGSFVPGRGTTSIPQEYSYTDNTALGGALSYRLRQVDLDGSVNYSERIVVDSPTSVKEHAPMQFALLQNYPNPFNPSTDIKFSVAKPGRATLTVFNSLGQLVSTLYDETAEAGQYYTVRFAAENLSSGTYFYRLQSGDRAEMKKLVIMK